MKNFKPILLALFVLAPLSLMGAETYIADSTHSSVNFSVRHFFSKVTGTFTKFEASIEVDRQNMEKSSVSATIEVDSINTNQEKRDAHLRNSEYFDTAKHPKMTFQSKSWKKTGENQFDVTGDFTLHGVTKSVVLKVTALGFGEGMKGAQLSGWEGKTTIKRSEFGITSGTPAVSDEVDIEINIEAKKK